jgi:hypothetical protein
MLMLTKQNTNASDTTNNVLFIPSSWYPIFHSLLYTRFPVKNRPKASLNGIAQI